MEKIKIQAVEIGLDNAGQYYYYDSDAVLQDGDNAYKIEIPPSYAIVKEV